MRNELLYIQLPRNRRADGSDTVAGSRDVKTPSSVVGGGASGHNNGVVKIRTSTGAEGSHRKRTRPAKVDKRVRGIPDEIGGNVRHCGATRIADAGAGLKIIRSGIHIIAVQSDDIPGRGRNR